MRKLFVLALIILLSTTSCFAWSWKKDSGTPLNQEYDNEGKGYVGTLPDLSKNYQSSEPKSAKPLYENSKKFNSSEEIKPVPRDNPAFVNIILKTDKTSPYVNDINDLLPQLENILTCIENNYDVQKFNAKVFFFNKTVEYLQNKYNGMPESSYISFQKLLTLNTHTKSVATLRAEAEKYRPYLAYTGAGYLYNDNVIDQQLDYLRMEIEETIVTLKEVR
jgi:hypothetical protein